MKTFIRVVELWVPDRTRTRLEFGGGLYSEGLSAFKAASEDITFGRDEGLPGKAWASAVSAPQFKRLISKKKKVTKRIVL